MYTALEKHVAVSYKVKHALTIQLSYPTARY